MIGERERYHGAALARLVQDSGRMVRIEFMGDASRCAYKVDGRNALYVKYSTKRISPWRFVFSSEERAQLGKFRGMRRQAILTLVCGNEGVAAVPWVDLQDLILSGRDEGFSLTVTRRDGHRFRVLLAGYEPIKVPESAFVALALSDSD